MTQETLTNVLLAQQERGRRRRRHEVGAADPTRVLPRRNHLHMWWLCDLQARKRAAACQILGVWQTGIRG